MESILLPRPLTYREACQVIENVVFAARFVIRQGYPRDVAAEMLDAALEGMYIDLAKEGSDVEV